jgi:hypothetical protein
MHRWWKRVAALSCGGVTFGWLQAWELVDFAGMWTQLLTLLLQVVITFLFGGDVDVYF